MHRRSFLQGLLFVAAAPAIVRIDSLMRLPPPRLLKPDGYGEGLVVDMLDIRGKIVRSALLRRVNEGDGQHKATSMLECNVPPTRVTTFRIRENGQIKREWFDGGDWVSGTVRFFDHVRT